MRSEGIGKYISRTFRRTGRKFVDGIIFHPHAAPGTCKEHRMNLFRHSRKPAFLRPPRGYARGGLARESLAASPADLRPPVRVRGTYVAACLTRRERGRLGGEFEATSLAASRLPRRRDSELPACSNRLFRQLRPFSRNKSVRRTVERDR